MVPVRFHLVKHGRLFGSRADPVAIRASGRPTGKNLSYFPPTNFIRDYSPDVHISSAPFRPLFAAHRIMTSASSLLCPVNYSRQEWRYGWIADFFVRGLYSFLVEL